MKLFKLTLVVFVGIFTMCALVMLFAGIFSLLGRTHTDATFGFGGGISFSVIRVTSVLVVLIVALLLWRLSRQR